MKMVQKDDHVYVNFEYRYPNSSYNISTKKEYIHKDAKSLSSIIKINIENKDYLIDRCILKLSDYEIDVTKIISDSDQFEKTLEEIKALNTHETLLKVLVVFSHKALQCSEDESSASPISDSEYNPLHISSVNKGLYRNRFTPAATENFIDNKNSDTSNNIDNARSIKSVPYNNAEPIEYKYVGLVNQAMTCYLNSLLQALYMTPEFRNAVYNWEYKSLEKNIEDKSIPYQLQKLFLNLQTSSKSAVETTSLTTSFGWNYHDAWDQHDIQELCRVMFDALEQTFKNTEQADLISRLYEGKINDYVKCLTCLKEKSREDTFLDIPLPVKPFDTNVAYGCVEEALEAFVKYETLEGNNQYFCEECNAMSNAHKGLKFAKFPYILTLQLKRFDFDQKSFHRIKLNDKVTFPDVLNLNSFIELKSNQESPSHEEDVGMSIKCDDSSTTDSSTMDEECVVNEIMTSNKNELNNPDQDDDEGIDMRVGMLSSCSTYNHSTQKLREEYTVAKGPYIYELFSIMIHSGSASGGHYYAYIKDFRTKKWLCFNDQIVTPIEHADIPKIYGGNSTRGSFYSGAYRSSTNAYMLMYRQIDPERNVLPLKAEDFPIHIKDLLEKIKRNEKDQNYHEDQFNMDNFIHQIYYRHPANGKLKQVKLSISMSYTLAQITECAYKKADLDDVELDQCRIVSYFLDYNLVNRTYDQKTRLDEIFKNQSKVDNLLLDIRELQNFEIYPSDPIFTKVFLVNPVKQELIDIPKYVRAYKKQTIKEYKQELTKYFDLNPNIVQVLCQAVQPKKLEDDFIFESQHSLLYICITQSFEAESIFFKMSENEYLGNIITFDLDVSDFSREQCESQKIPFFNESREEKCQQNDSSHYHYPTEEIAKLSMAAFDKYKYNNVTKVIDLQETSNSEDSSLSDSDRTLVGDAPEDSDLDCELAVTANKNDDVDIKKCIKITSTINSRLWKISISMGITEDELKEHLQKYLNIPKDYFKIFGKDEIRSFKIKTTFTEGLTYYIRLGKIINCDENKLDVYILEMAAYEPLRKLFTMTIKKNIPISSAKCQILEELKRNNNIEITCENCRFMEIIHDELFDENMSEEKSLKFLSEKICIQRLFDELRLDESQSVVYLKKWNRTEMQLEDVDNIIIKNDNYNERLKNEISVMAKIPIEYLQFHPLLVTKFLMSGNIEKCEWKSDINLEKIDLFKTYILFRDSRQTPKTLTERESHKIYTDKKILFERERMTMLTPMTSSPRKEKALKIHVHST